MDIERFEIFLRRTKFSELILAELWLGMSTLEKLDLMLYFKKSLRPLPDEINMKALDDVSPLVRMFAYKPSWNPNELEQKLIDRIIEDPHPFIRASTKYCEYDKMMELPHEERLAIIALSGSLTDGDEFAKFIVSNLENKSISEQEAGELVNEYVSNPAAADYVTFNPIDGLDWYGKIRAFKAIWELTILTPPSVSDSVVWKYPLVSRNTDTVPDDILKKMNDNILSKLVWRGYEPLIINIKKNPEIYNEELVKAVSDAEELKSDLNNKISDIDMLREELKGFRNEIIELLNRVLIKKNRWF